MVKTLSISLIGTWGWSSFSEETFHFLICRMGEEVDPGCQQTTFDRIVKICNRTDPTARMTGYLVYKEYNIFLNLIRVQGGKFDPRF